MNKLAYEDFVKISYDLVMYHSIFYAFWKCSELVFDDQIDTAAVSAPPGAHRILFRFNPDFWASLEQKERLFIICHEMLHIVFNHIPRTIKLKNSTTRPFSHELANIVQDLVINECLIKYFGFVKSAMPNLQQLYWFEDTLPGVPTDKNMEYYYELLMRSPLQNKHHGQLADEHPSLLSPDAGSSDATALDTYNDIIAIVSNSLSDTDKKELADQHFPSEASAGAGQTALGQITHVVSGGIDVRIRKLWEQLLTDKRRTKLRYSETVDEQWIKISRRGQLLSSDLMLPYTDLLDAKHPDKLTMWLFLDHSGSCYHNADYFFTLAKTVPVDKFDLHVFSFDTYVYPVDLQSETLRGGGGTAFDMIEDYIQAHADPYPSVVCIVTDGDGTSVSPHYPERWVWLLTEPKKRCIPDKSKIIPLYSL